MHSLAGAALALLLASFAPTPEPFDAVSFKIERQSDIVSKWIDLNKRLDRETPVLRRCREEPSCASSLGEFSRIIESERGSRGKVLVGRLNRAIRTSIRYTSDENLYGLIDHWSTPTQSFSTRAGDCEDLVIALYVALRESSIPDEDMRVVIGRIPSQKIDHAVLAVRLDGEWIIADPARTLVLMRDIELRNFVPLFVMNQSGVYALYFSLDDFFE